MNERERQLRKVHVDDVIYGLYWTKRALLEWRNDSDWDFGVTVQLWQEMVREIHEMIDRMNRANQANTR